MVLQELELMRTLDHPNVIKLHEVYEDSKYIHLVMPLFKGQELYSRMKKKCLYKESDAVPVMRNFLSALAYLHENSIVHRDLKPQNLIFASKTDNEDIKIVDFGFAIKLSSPEQTLIRACGSPGYVSPELI